ncbi:MAG: hypothetical protein JWO93_2917 [Micrococcaceae bacterium]|nr:hypothetical protein [Micrococcaceae bacterium]
MAQSVEVGSVLGGRYRVTARVLVSGEHDVVLDGVDRVLNRPVSILVAGPDNATNLTQGAREVATGERHANLQILDLGTGDGATYLITSQTGAAELLDLVVPTEPYVEPYFTDTLGNEIFGVPRSSAPDAADDEYVDTDGAQASEDTGEQEQVKPAATVPTAGTASHRLAAGAPTEAAPQVAPTGSTHTDKGPKVTLWSDKDFSSVGEQRKEQGTPDPDTEIATPAAARGATPRAAVAGAPAAGLTSGAVPEVRSPSSFPAAARDTAPYDDDDEDADYDDDDNAPRTGLRWLVGAVVVVILVGALIFAVTNLTGIFGTPVAGKSTSQTTTPAAQTATGSPSASASATPIVAPVIASVSRLVPDAPDMGNVYDSKLPATFDGNPGTYWQTLEYSNDTFAGLTSSVNLVVALKETSDVRTVTVTQLGGTGGSFRLLTNDKPTLQGAKEIGTGSFTSPDITLTAPQQTKAQYVILSFVQLPKQQSFQTYSYGAKIAEISIK